MNYAGFGFMRARCRLFRRGKVSSASTDQRGKSAADVPAALHYLQTLVQSVDDESYVLAEDDATERLRDRDGDDCRSLLQRWF